MNQKEEIFDAMGITSDETKKKDIKNIFNQKALLLLVLFCFGFCFHSIVIR